MGACAYHMLPLAYGGLIRTAAASGSMCNLHLHVCLTLSLACCPRRCSHMLPILLLTDCCGHAAQVCQHWLRLAAPPLCAARRRAAVLQGEARCCRRCWNPLLAPCVRAAADAVDADANNHCDCLGQRCSACDLRKGMLRYKRVLHVFYRRCMAPPPSTCTSCWISCGSRASCS